MDCLVFVIIARAQGSENILRQISHHSILFASITRVKGNRSNVSLNSNAILVIGKGHRDTSLAHIESCKRIVVTRDEC